MIEDLVLSALLVVALVFAILLILISTATVGRKLADVEYLTEAGVDGVRRIQANINIRTHLNRTFLGIVFVVITILLLSDAPLAIRTWTNRVLFAALMVSYALSSLMDWLAERKQLQILQAEFRDDHRRAFAAGVRDAEGKAVVGQAAEAQIQSDRIEATGIDTNTRVREAAISPVAVTTDSDATPVDVATIAPSAAQAIANAVRPVVVKDTLNAIADAIPAPKDAL